MLLRSKSVWIVAVAVGSFMVVETAEAKTSLPVNRSKVNNSNYSGTPGRVFGRNVSTSNTTVRNYSTSGIGRGVSFAQSNRVARQPSMAMRSRVSTPYTVTRSPARMSRSTIVRSVPSPRFNQASPVVVSNQVQNDYRNTARPTYSVPASNAPVVISSAPVRVVRNYRPVSR